jgi:hypothetical protein
MICHCEKRNIGQHEPSCEKFRIVSPAMKVCTCPRIGPTGPKQHKISCPEFSSIFSVVNLHPDVKAVFQKLFEECSSHLSFIPHILAGDQLRKYDPRDVVFSYRGIKIKGFDNKRCMKCDRLLCEALDFSANRDHVGLCKRCQT